MVPEEVSNVWVDAMCIPANSQKQELAEQFIDCLLYTSGEGSAVKWLVPSAQKNRMEPILVELAPGAQTEEQDPHEGCLLYTSFR